MWPRAISLLDGHIHFPLDIQHYTNNNNMYPSCLITYSKSIKDESNDRAFYLNMKEMHLVCIIAYLSHMAGMR